MLGAYHGGQPLSLPLCDVPPPHPPPSCPKRVREKNKKEEGSKEKHPAGAKGEFAVIANVSISLCFFPLPPWHTGKITK